MTKLDTIVFDQLPVHDTCWSLMAGVDGRIYAGVCGEMTGGLSAYIAAYDPARQRTDYLVEMATALGIPPDNGQATHSKVHYSLLQDGDGTLYAATHCTGAPLGDTLWRPWNCWNHPQKQFSGSGLVCFNPDGGINYHQLLLHKEGSRCLALARQHRLIYGISYPRNHFFVFDLGTRQTHDIGRIGNINPQCIFTDQDENAYTADDYGHILQFDPTTSRLFDTGEQIPHASFRDGYHNTFYDVCPEPSGQGVWGVTWTWGARLVRFDFATRKLQDFGKAVGEESPDWSHIIHEHVGGMTFGADAKLYFVANLPADDGASRPHLVQFDPATARREILAPLQIDGAWVDHIARGALGSDRKLYFAEAGNTPTKLVRADLGHADLPLPAIRRTWG